MRADDPLAPHRPRLLGLAYRMLGDRGEAEDVLQDAFLRYAGAGEIASTGPFLTKTVTRLCLDRLKCARSRRESYVGTWLPDPILDTSAMSPDASTELADDLSFALLLALERLSPAERAAFLLHDVFDLSFREVGAILERSQEACRQLASRARRAVRRERNPQKSNSTEHTAVIQAFGAALASGDLEALTAVLKADAVMLSDAGGLRPSALNPIRGAANVARLLLGARRKSSGLPTLQTEFTLINGLPGVVQRGSAGAESTVAFAVEHGRIAAIYVTRHPGKLARLL